MASATKMTTASGQPFYRLEVSRGRGKSKLTKRWYIPLGWSEKSIQKELQHQLRLFETACENGEVLSRADKKAKEEEARQAALRDPTVGDYFQRFLKARDPILAENSLKIYRDCFQLHVLPVFGGVRLSELKTQAINEFITELTGQYKYNTVVTIYKHFRTVVRAAVREEVLTRDPFLTVDPPKRPKSEPVESGMDKSLSTEDLGAFIDGLKEEPLFWQAFFMVTLDTGARCGEVCGLRWSDVNWRDKTLSISRSAITSTPKSSHSVRTIDLGDDTLALLKAHQQDQASRCLSQWIFPARRDPGLPLNPSSAEMAAKRLRKRTGVDSFHIHALRHTSATMSILGGADIVSVSRRMGHASPAITTGIYTHPNPDSIRAAGDVARQAIKRARKEPTDKAN